MCVTDRMDTAVSHWKTGFVMSSPRVEHSLKFARITNLVAVFPGQAVF